MTLVILAAGLGSRYGGLKQIDPISDNGEFIIDFSIYDAIKAGFNKVVFIIKEENLEDFRDTIGKRVEPYIEVEYAFQSINDLPDGFLVPEGRQKPWGTAQALLCAEACVKEKFAVINADDFYGREAFIKLAEHLSSVEDTSSDYCMIGYVLRNTLTENGTVSRGRCETDENGKLKSITELTKIKTDGNDALYFDESDNWISLSGDTTVSMNCWGLTPTVFDGIKDGFVRFLSSNKGRELKSEFYLPGIIDELMNGGICQVQVYSTNAHWYGVTYAEDKEKVKLAIKKLIDDGVYPYALWK